MMNRGEEMGKNTQTLSREDASERQNYLDSNLPATAGAKHHMTAPPRSTALSSANNKDNLANIIEAVSQAKEGILKDLSRLLDDKLAGLDEVVVELIRCKSENDGLKQKLKLAMDEKQQLNHELSKFKQVQFGFYRKTN